MTSRRIFAAGLMLLMLLCTACAPSALPSKDAGMLALQTQESSTLLSEESAPLVSFPDIACLYYDPALTDVHTAFSTPDEDCSQFSGAIVPHYAPAMYLTADLLSSRSAVPDTVVIVGPNHSGQGSTMQICSAGYFWESGSLPGDTELAAALVDHLGIQQDDRAAREDWSISLQMPYLQSYFPETKVVTILLSRGADTDTLTETAEFLADYGETQDLLLLGSVDFSHYQDPETAAACDEETLRIIADSDIARLLTLENSHLDSPETIFLLQAYAKAGDMELLQIDSHFECFQEQGQQLAGSYYTFVIK